ncbi:hypothetical protein BVG19_g5547 [[Candida] boidinii]|nr:hypothetical protein BVG19_g5547 [[Candida] boidinii]OWB53919.1 hypothetical protein B5S27_g5534 [[Candida] boidinii]
MAKFNKINFSSKKNQEIDSAAESFEIISNNSTISAVESETVETNIPESKPSVTDKTFDTELIATKKSSKTSTKGFRVEKRPKKFQSNSRDLKHLLTKDLDQKEQRRLPEGDTKSLIVKMEEDEPVIPIANEPVQSNSAACTDDSAEEEYDTTASTASTFLTYQEEAFTAENTEVEPDMTMLRMKYNYLQKIESQIEFRDETKFTYMPDGSKIPNSNYASPNVSVKRTGCRYEFGFIPGNPYADIEREFFNRVLITKKPEKFTLILRSQNANR